MEATIFLKIKNSATPRLQSMSFFDEISGVENQIYREVEFPIPGADILPVFWAQELVRTSRVLQEWAEEWDAQATRWLVCDWQ